jgi:2-polyprenyl-3-methyl-5-hydroxy-6-metoxy-1,4-benzoquinol methylase
MTNSTKEMYERHHREARGEGFSILEKERGELFKKIIGTGKTVLDLGCRDGALTKYFLVGNKVTGTDVDEVALARAKTLGIEPVAIDLNGDWRELEDRTFDVVVAGETLEHLYYPDRVAEKVARHLTPGGMFLGSVPNAFSLKNRARLFLAQKKYTPLHDPTHINHFSAGELATILKKHFSDVEIQGLGRYSRLSKLSPGLFAFDLIFIAKK